MASFAAILAIGNPVALDASAEERDTRGFISMTSCRPVAGSTANCTFEPPVSTPMRRSTANAASRICWYSGSDSVMAGATVIESPVWTPIASRFSIEQIDHAVVVAVAHDLELVLLPAEHGLLDEDLVDRRVVQALADHASAAGPRRRRCRRPCRRG